MYKINISHMTRLSKRCGYDNCLAKNSPRKINTKKMYFLINLFKLYVKWLPIRPDQLFQKFT